MCVDSMCHVWITAGVGYLASLESFGVFYSFTAVSGFTGFYSLPSRAKLLSYTHMIIFCLIIWLYIFPADVK